MRNLIKKILKESEDDWGWVEDTQFLPINDIDRYDLIEETISRVLGKNKIYHGINTWKINWEAGVLNWYLVKHDESDNPYLENYIGHATPEWTYKSQIPVDISSDDGDYNKIAVITTPEFKYKSELIKWYETEYFKQVDELLSIWLDQQE